MILKLKNGFVLNEFLVELFEFGSNSVAILDQNGDILYANPFFIVNTEHSKEEILTLNYRDLISPEFISKFDKIFSIDLQSSISWRGEIEHIRKNTSIYWTTSYFFKKKSDEFEDFFLVFEDDISSIKHLTTQLEIKANQLYEEKYKIETILDNIPYGILVIEPDFTINYQNERIMEMMEKEFKRKLLINSNLINYLPNVIISEIIELMKFEINKELIVNFDSNKHWQINTLILENENTEKIFITVLRDISSFIEFEKLQKQFITSVSHELRTPIASILLSINNFISFRDKLNDSQNNSLLKIIRQNAYVLKNIVEDLLIVSNIDNKKLAIRSWKELELSTLLKDTILQMNPQIEQKNISIDLICPECLNIFGDEERLSQIIRIPLDNSIKYSDSNSEIIISVLDNYHGIYNMREENGLLITIKDFGIGIRKNEMNYTFKRFFRGSNVQNIKGTGIGLSILKELVQLINGQVFIESEESKGTKVMIFIPKLNQRP